MEFYGEPFENSVPSVVSSNSVLIPWQLKSNASAI